MPQNGLSVGDDLRITITTQFGNIDVATGVTFNATPIISTKNVLPIVRKIPIHLRFPQGWQGTIEGARNGPELDDYWTAVEELYYSGGQDLGSSIIQTIREPDDSTSKFIFTDVVFSLEEPGTWQQDNSVDYRFMFYGSRRQKVPFAG